MAKAKTNSDGKMAIQRGDGGNRKLSTARNDDVSKKLGECKTPKEMLILATKFGITREEVSDREKNAPNFGQLRTVIGNRIRGIVNRLEKASTKGIDLDLADAAYPKAKRQRDKEAKAKAKVAGVTKKVKKVAKEDDGDSTPPKAVKKSKKPVAVASE